MKTLKVIAKTNYVSDCIVNYAAMLSDIDESVLILG